MAMTPLSQAMLQGMMLQRQAAQPMLADQGQPAPTWRDMLQGRSATSRPNGLGSITEINPGVLWGGKDKNAMQPADVTSNRFYGLPIEGL